MTPNNEKNSPINLNAIVNIAACANSLANKSAIYYVKDGLLEKVIP